MSRIALMAAALVLGLAAVPTKITLIGDEALCRRYALALEVRGMAVSQASADATTRGQWLLAQAAGLAGA